MSPSQNARRIAGVMCELRDPTKGLNSLLAVAVLLGLAYAVSRALRPIG
ncbi:hypothetical protein [Krasilnikovia sp. MM14-A1259]